MEMDARTKKTLEAFVEAVKKREKDNLLKVVLFGSVARRRDTHDSDIDVFLLMRRANREKRYEMCDIAHDVDMEYGDFKTYIAPFVMGQASYDEGNRMGIPVLKNIEREGVVLFERETSS